MRFFAPAKLNLSLDLGPVRADGYHEIRTVMQAVSLGDRLFVAPAPRLRVENPAVAGEDLVVRAATLFSDATGVAALAQIRVDKRIPIGAGLGGGSSDAACALRALRATLLPALPWSELVAMARSLGSDVPFFLCAAPRALAAGRGEVLSPLPPAPPLYAVIGWPGVGLGTADVYRASRQGPGDATERVLAGAACARNDLAPTALALCPELRRLVAAAGAEGVSLQVTGSGSAAFALYADPGEAAAALGVVRLLAPRAILCQTLQAWPCDPQAERGAAGTPDPGEDSGRRRRREPGPCA